MLVAIAALFGLALGHSNGPAIGAGSVVLLALSGLGALFGGALFKFTLITRAAYNQGFALARLPVRGVRRRPAGS